jgi:L-aspartate oxidase
MRARADVLVVGAGIAGAGVALRLAEAGLRVTVLAKGPVSDSSSYQAQGGLAAAIGPDDSPARHAADTLAAGGGLCHERQVQRFVAQAPATVSWLLGLGVDFDPEPGGGGLALTREGGHSRRRIVHARDATGAAIMEVLGRHLAAHPRIELLAGTAVDLLTRSGLGLPGPDACVGLQLLDANGRLPGLLFAPQVVLATGGAAGIYTTATNPARPVGDGIAMAWRAGCRLANLEHVQFHPTALRHPRAEGWLVTEALRGEGAHLRLPDGERFMLRHDPRGELAPRDIVARAIYREMTDRGLDRVWLDAHHLPADFLRRRFPAAVERCAARGIDITREPIPVAPAAHYFCGGVRTDGSGATDLAGLYAIGETACTGLHGANRLASNSLLEGVVSGATACDAILADSARRLPDGVAISIATGSASAIGGEAETEAAALAVAIRGTMSRQVGIVRNDRDLRAALTRLAALEARCGILLERHGLSPALLELKNLACVAGLVARSALARRESRGAHFNSDHPQADAIAAETILSPANDAVDIVQPPGAHILPERAVA